MKMTKTKKIAAAVISFAIVGTVALSSTMAYLTDRDTATNTFTVGHVKIVLTEPSYTDNQSMEPGVTVEKDPLVTNTGTNPAYVRLKVKIPQAVIGNPAATKDLFTIGYLSNGTFQTGISPATATISGTEVKWVLGSDGFYYLKTVAGADYQLPAAGVTPKLFTQIMLSPDLREGQLTNASGQDYATSNVEVIAEAVQTGSFANAAAAWAAFDTENPAT